MPQKTKLNILTKPDNSLNMNELLAMMENLKKSQLDLYQFTAGIDAYGMILKAKEDALEKVESHIRENLDKLVSGLSESAQKEIKEKLNSITEEIISKNIDFLKGEKGDDGLVGKDGVSGRDGFDGLDGKTPIKNIDYFDGSPDTPEQIKEKILKVKLPIEAIANLQSILDELRKMRTSSFFGGRGGGGGGGTPETLVITGTVDGQNDTFTLNKPFTFIVLHWNGQFQEPTTHYTISGTTITFVDGHIPTEGTIHGYGHP